MKVFGVVLAAVLLASNNSGDRAVFFSDEPGGDDEVMIDESPAPGYDRESIDIATLLTAARGAPPAICSLASLSVRGWGWGDRSDAPVTPLGKQITLRDDNGNSRTLSQEDIQLLFSALASDDACVREIGVRVIGR